MTPREADADLLSEIKALREHVVSLTRENAELQGALTQAHAQVTEALTSCPRSGSENYTGGGEGSGDQARADWGDH
jgi:hypothetical protein